MSGSMFNRGYDDVEKKVQEREERRANNVFRFWMPWQGNGNKTRIVFLDDNPPVYEEHQLKIDGSWKNWHTCLAQFGKPCPDCQAKNKNYTAAAYTIIDGTEWKDGKGNVHKNERKLYVVKLDSLKYLKEVSAKRGGLRGCIFEIMRTSDKSPSTGNQFDFDYKMTEAELKQFLKGHDDETLVKLLGKQPADSIEPYDYDTILAPKSEAEMAEQLDKAAATSYEEDGNVRF